MSGFHDPFAERSDAELAAAAAGSNTVASLQAGHPFSLLLAADDHQRDALLESTLDAVADTATRFTRATNPLRARLTLERLLLQVIQGSFDLERETAADIVRRIAARRGDEARVVLVIERSETLHPEVLRFLGEAAVYFPDGDPHLQVLFVGRPEFHAMLDDPDAGLDEQTQQLESYRPAAEPEPAFTPAPMDYDAPIPTYVARTPGLTDQFQAAWNGGLGARVAIVGGTLGGLAAVGFAAFIALSGDEPIQAVDTGSALLEMPEPAETDPDPPALAAGPAPDAATAQLRGEFESYLIASGREAANMSPGQRRTTYQEFLVWRARTGRGR